MLTIFGGLDYRQLNFVSLSSVSAATVVAFALPPIEDTVYFHRPRELESAEDKPLQSGAALSTSLRKSLLRIVKDFKDSFGDAYVVKWSLWWALGMCGNFQVNYYNQKGPCIQYKSTRQCFANYENNMLQANEKVSTIMLIQKFAIYPYNR